MRLELNLATQPYHDVRRFLTQWTAGLVIVAIVTAGLLYMAISSYMTWRVDYAQENELRAKITARDQVRNEARAFLNHPENTQVRDRSAFINELIARKALSWTQVFSDLEKIMPGQLQVLNIHPEINKQGQLEMVLTVAGNSREKAIELVRRLEDSKDFRDAQVRSETLKSQTSGTRTEFDISAVYIPRFDRKGGQQ
jgi:type IV pilus assembly protein PilN